MIIGIGNEYRRDDGLGPRVVADLLGRQPGDPALAGVDLRVSDGESLGLLSLWAGAELAVVVDAVRDGQVHAGRVHELVLDDGDEVDPAGRPSHGTHDIGFGDTVALGRALGRMPHRLVIIAVAGHDFGFGPEPSAPVAAAVLPVADRARELVSRP
ncbi:hydrogenase maturation protease [Actinoplanes sp. NPDC049265]|uniref:hydrogenase maturation protease n=1 Tax=Actinoplanes sp. NPDC049265 TaxID=3363902 RepID=UPI00371C177C